MMNQDTNNNTRKLNIWLPLLFSFILVGGMFIGMKLQNTVPSIVIDSSHQLPEHALGQGKLEEILRYIEAKYVDETDREELIEKAINNILQQLDPHSNYITAEQLKDINEQLEGNFQGIGVEFMLLDDTIIVVTPLSGGPSEAVGIQSGDKIVQIEDSLVAGINIQVSDVISMLRGEKGSKVRVGILRGKDKVKEFTITRDDIPVHSVDASFMLDENTGYIKINRFSATTYEEFMKGMEQLVEDNKLEHLIIDVRRNPGGYLQQAINILNQIIQEKDKLLVYTEGRAVNRSDYESSGRAFFDIDKIAVLIDEGSASASEILSGAIQDWDRGVIIGRRSFGKGLVQEQYKLRDGSALRLTVARYYTPSGRSIQKAYSDNDHYDEDVHQRLESGELYSADKIAIADTTNYYTAAGRLVYGGGGITPDAFVALDSTLMDEYYLRLRQHIPEFIYRYMSQNDEKNTSNTIQEFIDTYSVSDHLLRAFTEFAFEKGVKRNEKQQAKVEDDIRHYLKARIARHYYKDDGFYAVWNQEDQMVQKALSIIKTPNPLSVADKMK